MYNFFDFSSNFLSLPPPNHAHDSSLFLSLLHTLSPLLRKTYLSIYLSIYLSLFTIYLSQSLYYVSQSLHYLSIYLSDFPSPSESFKVFSSKFISQDIRTLLLKTSTVSFKLLNNTIFYTFLICTHPIYLFSLSLFQATIPLFPFVCFSLTFPFSPDLHSSLFDTYPHVQNNAIYIITVNHSSIYQCFVHLPYCPHFFLSLSVYASFSSTSGIITAPASI
ncbi:unnamed protein product [Acanthosepion pharaonis]|uniref:Uncharacterized protein n=1 Tax=Acanthosepion pharaonis TaxID=158019 RepID=A0A812DCL2_ACAPH|nr:unnamed protein product [Sepia pharaonis]